MYFLQVCNAYQKLEILRIWGGLSLLYDCSNTEHTTGKQIL